MTSVTGSDTFILLVITSTVLWVKLIIARWMEFVTAVNVALLA